jgi:hypothetical protein
MTSLFFLCFLIITTLYSTATIYNGTRSECVFRCEESYTTCVIGKPEIWYLCACLKELENCQVSQNCYTKKEKTIIEKQCRELKCNWCQ